MYYNIHFLESLLEEDGSTICWSFFLSLILILTFALELIYEIASSVSAILILIFGEIYIVNG